MIINDAGRKLIMSFESLSLTPYLCPAGKWTIGFGHTGDVEHDSKPITQHQAEVILEFDLHRFEEAVSSACPGANENQFSAMVCLAFNIGESAFRSSTLVKKFRGGFFSVAAEEFLRWNHAQGKVLDGLTRRRTAERALYLTKVNQA